MTVCIAALASRAQKGIADSVVLASDRMVTLGGFIEFEHQIPKVVPISKNAFLLMAGDALRGSQIARSLVGAFMNSMPTVAQAGQTASSVYHQMRMAAVDQDILQPRGLNLREFNQGQQQQLLQQLAFTLSQEIANYDLNVDLIIAGVDAGGGHIYTINNPGLRADDHDQIGFTGIGSGAIHAMQSFIAAHHTKHRSLEQTIFNVYAAKRRSEVAPGVGNETDMLVVTPEGFSAITQDQMTQLDNIYVGATQPAYDQIVEQVTALNLLTAPSAPEDNNGENNNEEGALA